MSNLSRYFIEFSYIGSRFRGVAKQVNVDFTVHNVIKTVLCKLNDEFEVKSDLYISSRTDAGVHAVKNTAHFDVELNHEYLSSLNSGPAHPHVDALDSTFVPNRIQSYLNEFFIANNVPIRILKCINVNLKFYSRRAVSRTYLYRLAMCDNGVAYMNEDERIKKVHDCLVKDKLISDLITLDFTRGRNFTNSIDESFLTQIRPPFDRDLFVKALELYNGKHDFSAFTTNMGRKDMWEKNKNPVKNIEIKVQFDSDQFMSQFMHGYHEKYKIIDILIKGESFLYKMIRKMVGAAVDVARGKVPIQIITSMLETPKDHYETSITRILKPNGLFLKNVEYDKSAFD